MKNRQVLNNVIFKKGFCFPKCNLIFFEASTKLKFEAESKYILLTMKRLVFIKKKLNTQRHLKINCWWEYLEGLQIVVCKPWSVMYMTLKALAL